MSYRSLANKGRYGDSEIRNVAGRKSHVNPREASLIDLWGALGASLVQREGAGTRNPKTGMPEYHGKWGTSKKMHPRHHTLAEMANPLSHLDATLDQVGAPIDLDTENMFTQDYNPSIGDEGGYNLTQSGVEETAQDPEPVDPADFDPSSEDFRTMVTETGDYSLLNEGYKLEAGDTEFFDKPNMEQLGFIGEQATLQLDFIDQEFDISQANIGIGKDTLTENLRSATSSYDTGVESSNLQTGRSWTANKQQGDLARSRSNMATSGTIDTMQKTTGKGIWQDYTQQRKTLSNQMTSATSAFDLGGQSLDVASTRGQQAYDRGISGVDLTKRRGESTFWEGLESDYYAMAGNLLPESS